MPAKRERKLTERKWKKIIELVRNGYPFVKVCELVKIDESTLWHWRKKFKDFDEAIQDAKRRFRTQIADYAEAELIKLLKSEKDEVKLRTAIYLLEKYLPEIFGNKQQITLSGGLNFGSLSNEQRKAIEDYLREEYGKNGSSSVGGNGVSD